jgi:hypothetical protein
MPHIDYSLLERELKSAAADAFERLCEAASGEHVYAFGLYTCGEGTYLVATGNSEEALRQAANRKDVPAEALRWSPCDWPYHEIGRDLFVNVQRVLDEAWSDDFSETMVDALRVFDIALRVLQELSGAGVFGVEDARKKIVINLWKGDQSREELAAWGAQLNPHFELSI